MKDYDFIIIGSGIAGLNFALNAAKKGNVLIITKKKIVSSNTNFAQGGIAAVLNKYDSFKKHINDTMQAGAMHNKRSAVKYMVENGPRLIQKLINLGVPFEKTKNDIELAKEGGHTAKRIAFVGDKTGAEIEKSLIKAVKASLNITIFEDTFATDLFVKNKKCYGVQILKKNKIRSVFASATILATGGLGQVYQYTSNPKIATGDGIAMAARAGCKLSDLEFIQFHPTSLNVKRRNNFLISETLRGEGAILLNSKGEKFMKNYDKRKELAPRDIVARAIFTEMQNGPVYLDITHKKSAFLKNRFPTIFKRLEKTGIDMSKSKIPITPAAHYSCGGIKVNLKGETSIKNLFAFGEVACTGVHGANRLGSNSLLEAIVFSDSIIQKLQKNPSSKNPEFPKYKITKGKKQNLYAIRKKIKNIMWENVGIERNVNNLQEAIHQLQELKKEFTISSPSINEFETKNLIEIAILIATSAINRRTSLGCHMIKS